MSTALLETLKTQPKLCQYILTLCLKVIWSLNRLSPSVLGLRREKGFANNKGTDQPAHSRRLISAFVNRILESIKRNFSLASLCRRGDWFEPLGLSETPRLLDSHDFQINHFKPYQYLRWMERSSVKVLQWPDTSPENLVSPVFEKIPLMSQKLPRSVCILSICSPIFVSRRILKWVRPSVFSSVDAMRGTL